MSLESDKAMNAPSYHDVVVTLNGVDYSMDKGYRHRLVCQHLTGWELQERVYGKSIGTVEWAIVGG